MTTAMPEIKNKIEELAKKINDYNYDYYVLNEPKISDYDFDMLLKELEHLEQETGFILPWSPTQRVGSDLQKEFKDVTRTRMMGSIANCYDYNELETWLKQFNFEDTFILEPKYDGLSCSLIYKNGILVQASTRGNGLKGSEVTENAKTIKSIPLKIELKEDAFYKYIKKVIQEGLPETIEVRGEILLPKSELGRINQERIDEGLPPFANERNCAAGSLKQLDPKITASRNLIFYPYAVYVEDIEFEKKYLNYQYDMLDFAEALGFKSPNYWRAADANTVLVLLSEFEQRFLYQQDYCMDGCVIKISSKERQNELGYTQKVPKWAKAFKFKQEQGSTKLIGVEWQMGRTGKLSPVGIVEPVEIDGTIIKNVTLNNIDFIREMNLQIGSYILIERGGGVIPKVIGVDYERNKAEDIVLETKDTI